MNLRDWFKKAQKENFALRLYSGRYFLSENKGGLL